MRSWIGTTYSPRCRTTSLGGSWRTSRRSAQGRRAAAYRRGEQILGGDTSLQSALTVAYAVSSMLEKMPGELRSAMDILLAKMPDVDHDIQLTLGVSTRAQAVAEAIRLGLL